ncbi:hypothetical protein RhiJN_16473 [Ceratobasidium sp. AG-Ba]|nr:hypothetical protein RhiJN_16473 [Ceratobasidium sp. AG-Ba]
MSKRRVAPGGYEESSDESEPEVVPPSNPPAKKSKSAPYAPPRLTTVPKAGPSTFQLPRATPLPANRSASLRPTDPVRLPSVGPKVPPMVTKPVLLEDDLDFPNGEHTSKGFSPDVTTPPEQSTFFGAAFPDGASASGSNTENVTANPVHARTKISNERQFNELREDLNAYMASNDAQHKKTQDMISSLFEWIDQRIASQNADTPQVQAQAHAQALETSDSKPDKLVLSNPPVTPEIFAIVAKVHAEARSRVGKKKNTPEDNSVKEHTRSRFYRMIGITAARFIPPHFENEYGEPDTLPAAFRDHRTGYCTPKIHWKAILPKQIAWVPTFLLWFKCTIPNDGSKLSEVLRSLSDEQIIILLYDGPLKTCQTTFRDMKKTDEEIKAMQVQALKYRHRERKASGRAQCILTFIVLQGADWEFLSHPGWMSEEESDGEGGVLILRPDYRAQWVNNFFEAIRIAQIKNARSQPGLSSRPPRRRIETVKRPIPQLERGTGSSRVAVRIALCGISRSWRAGHPDELQKSQHLINFKATTKPNLDSFLAQHPMADNSDNSDNEGEDTTNTGGWDCTQPTDAVMDLVDEPQRETSLDTGNTGNPAENGLMEEKEPGFDLGDRYQGDIIDPELERDAQTINADSQSNVGPARPAVSSSTSNTQLLLEDTGAPPCIRPTGLPQMPPPPPLSKNLIQTSNPERATPNPEPPKPKRRGRPPGSKNKPKVMPDCQPPF